MECIVWRSRMQELICKALGLLGRRAHPTRVREGDGAAWLAGSPAEAARPPMTCAALACDPSRFGVS